MLGSLLKKQMSEMFRSFFYDQKKNKKRSVGSTIVFFGLYVLLMLGVIGGSFSFVAYAICEPLCSVGMDWLYFVILGAIAIFFGTFGSVFSSFQGLYLAKDNDFLVSMPIPIWKILMARLLGVYLLGLMYCSTILIPMYVFYFITMGVTVKGIVATILTIVNVSLINLILSCILGWVVAKISVKLKNKSIFTVLLSVAFIALYYFVYFKANEAIRNIVMNAAEIGAKISSFSQVLVNFGKACAGNAAELGIETAIVFGITLLVYYVLSHSFIKIVTTSTGSTRVKYKTKRIKVLTPAKAILRKEFGRFTASPNYMLNCGLGILFIPAVAVFAVVKRSAAVDAVAEFGLENYLPLAIAALMCTLASMNDTTAPSVSLEGKSIWIPQSLPLDPWIALRAKLLMHGILTLPLVLVATIVISVVLNVGLVDGVLVVVITMLYVLLSGMFGLFVNLKRPSLNWTNEIYPIKQSLSVFIGMFSGWGYAALLVAGTLLLKRWISFEVFFGIYIVLTVIADFLLYRWLKNKGTKVFAEL